MFLSYLRRAFCKNSLAFLALIDRYLHYYIRYSDNVILLFFYNKKVDNMLDCVKLFIQLENRRTAYVYVKMFNIP